MAGALASCFGTTAGTAERDRGGRRISGRIALPAYGLRQIGPNVGGVGDRIALAAEVMVTVCCQVAPSE